MKARLHADRVEITSAISVSRRMLGSTLALTTAATLFR
jgi:hypothetical protein